MIDMASITFREVYELSYGPTTVGTYKTHTEVFDKVIGYTTDLFVGYHEQINHDFIDAHNENVVYCGEEFTAYEYAVITDTLDEIVYNTIENIVYGRVKDVTNFNKNLKMWAVTVLEGVAWEDGTFTIVDEAFMERVREILPKRFSLVQLIEAKKKVAMETKEAYA